MVSSPLDHEPGRPWTIDDLMGLPEIAGRVEIQDGSLRLTPPPNLYHSGVESRLERLLARQAPAGLFVGHDAGVLVRGDTYYVPDIYVADESATARDAMAFEPQDVALVVEVLSKSNRRNDLVVKREDYASAKIQAYWIVDPEQQALTVLGLGDDGEYQELAVVRPGTAWSTDRPFSLTLDPAEFL